jgi:uncharacterized membrane protein
MGGLSAGAGLMFLLDPRSGRRRRAQLRERVTHDARTAAAGAGKSVHDLGHRSRGLAARARAVVKRRPVSDEIVEERVRAALGRACSHPGAIEVACRDGQVQLTGAVLAAERLRVRAVASGVRGVKGITELLEAHENPGQISRLQGGSTRGQARRRWVPATSLVAGLGGAGLLAAGMRRRGGSGWTMAGIGGALLARALVNAPLEAIVGVGRRWPGIQIDKTIHVRASVEDAFRGWSNFESFPRFMTHVKEVKPTGDGRYRWRVGAFQWEAEVSAREPNRLIAWRSLPGALVPNQGSVSFHPDDQGGTEISVRLAYRPPAGLLGHALARLVGLDPKHEMDEDLLRFKSLLEQGSATGRGAQVTRDEVRPQ